MEADDQIVQYEVLDWYQCYKEKWGDILQPESYDHPAKVAYGLAERIYKHLMESGYLQPGDTVLDPFGGIGGLAYHAMLYGINFIGVELEQKFYDMAEGCDCTGVSKEDWVRYQGRLGRIRFKDGRHICPKCVAESRMVDEKHDKRQLSLFNPPESSKYRRNSGKIPVVSPHRYTGNLESWRKKAGMTGSARMILGDSRKLLGLVSQVRDGAISSPPYGDTPIPIYGENPGGGIAGPRSGDVDNSQWVDERGYSNENGVNLGNLKYGDIDAALSSPPYAETRLDTLVAGRYFQEKLPDGSFARGEMDMRKHFSLRDGYGATQGQLGSMRDGNLDGAVSSPPYAQSRVDNATQRRAADESTDITDVSKGTEHYGVTGGQLSLLPEGDLDAAISSPPYANTEIMPGKANPRTPDDRQEIRKDGQWKGYNPASQSNLGSMDEGDFDSAISSPPYEAAIEKRSAGSGAVGRGEFPVGRSERAANEAGYGDTDGQLGGEVGNDFWMAARQIVDQVYASLKPGGVAVWITKDYVRDGKIIRFSEMWERLCHASGFETIEWVHAWFIEEGEVQMDFDGNHHKKRIERKSFFRRLQETKGSPRIDYEDVVIMQKGLV